MEIAISLGFVALFAIIALVVTVSRLIIIVPPNTAAIITGRRNRESERGYRTVIGGRTIRIPILEKVEYISLGNIPLDITVGNAYSRGNIPLDIQAVANVKIASDPDSTFANAIERLLGRERRQIEQVARETLAANLRGVLAQLTPEEVNEDRNAFASHLAEEAGDDFQKLGLTLDTLRIQNVSDQVGYLEAVGRRKTAEVVRDAEVSEAEAQAETREKQAEADRRAETARALADIEIAEAQNRLRVRRAELNQEAESRELVAVAEARREEAMANRRLEEERIELERKRLQADVVEPAEAARRAAEEEARAAAAPILERGRAQAQALREIFAEIKNGGESAVQVLALEKLPEMLRTSVDAVEGVNIDRLVVVDQGDGRGAANAVNQRVNGAYAFMEQLGGMAGVDLAGLLRGVAQNAGSGASAPGDSPSKEVGGTIGTGA